MHDQCRINGFNANSAHIRLSCQSLTNPGKERFIAFVTVFALMNLDIYYGGRLAATSCNITFGGSCLRCEGFQIRGVRGAAGNQDDPYFAGVF